MRTINLIALFKVVRSHSDLSTIIDYESRVEVKSRFPSLNFIRFIDFGVMINWSAQERLLSFAVGFNVADLFKSLASFNSIINLGLFKCPSSHRFTL